jgi:hypothetical protein
VLRRSKAAVVGWRSWYALQPRMQQATTAEVSAGLSLSLGPLSQVDVRQPGKDFLLSDTRATIALIGRSGICAIRSG